ncbi:amidohydrolase [Corallococcus sp. 4LFB]|uniref:amidohydrolase n=1 Tax=Corallococcus sp. 4LFB TaxID=3383249 RepID=UPI003976341F
MNEAEHPQPVPGTSVPSGLKARARRVLQHLDAVLPDVDALYVDLHEHPELSGHEARTASEVARRLEPEGYEVSRDVGGHGVVGLLRNGDGPTVLLRGDMDALPVEEKTGLPYASRVRTEDGEPVMHACGHDVHTACLVGTAAVLARSRDAWRGTVMVVGQPAEETLQGAKAMLDAGLYARFGTPDAVLGQHTAPLPVGTFMHREGVAMMASAHVRVRLFGRGAHGAMPELSVDPVVLGASVVMRLQTIVSRALSPLEPAVVTVGQFQAGSRANVIPDEALLELTVRTEDAGVQARVLAAIERIAKGEAAASGAPRPPQVEVLERTPVNRNDPALLGRVRDAHASVGRARWCRACSPPRARTSPSSPRGRSTRCPPRTGSWASRPRRPGRRRRARRPRRRRRTCRGRTPATTRRTARAPAQRVRVTHRGGAGLPARRQCRRGPLKRPRPGAGPLARRVPRRLPPPRVPPS